jgi:cytochrome P450
MPFQSLAWMRRHGPFLRRCHARYGDIFTLRLAYEGNVVILAHPDAVREVFTGDQSVVHAGEASAVLRPIVGRESVLVLDDRPHLLKRKLLLPQFHGGHMPGYEALMREVAEREVERWPNDQAFSLLPCMHTIAVEVILQALLGVAQGSYLERSAIRCASCWTGTPKRGQWQRSSFWGPPLRSA